MCWGGRDGMRSVSVCICAAEAPCPEVRGTEEPEEAGAVTEERKREMPAFLPAISNRIRRKKDEKDYADGDRPTGKLHVGHTWVP